MTDPDLERFDLDLEDEALLKALRAAKPARREPIAPPSPGQRVADQVTAVAGSWRFIIIQSVILVFWIAANVMGWLGAWDPYPFILLNLMLSFQAAYTAPIILMSQNRMAAQDRATQQNDYDVNLKAELEIELLHAKLDALRDRHLAGLSAQIAILQADLRRLEIRP